MAELLIKARDSADSTHPMAWKHGMVVVVMPDGTAWGKREALPPAQGGSFFVLQISDLTTAQLAKWFSDRALPDLCSYEMSAVTTERQAIARRVFQLRVADIPPAVRQQINTTGRYATTWDAIRSFIQNRITQANL